MTACACDLSRGGGALPAPLKARNLHRPGSSPYRPSRSRRGGARWCGPRGRCDCGPPRRPPAGRDPLPIGRTSRRDTSGSCEPDPRYIEARRSRHKPPAPPGRRRGARTHLNASRPQLRGAPQVLRPPNLYKTGPVQVIRRLPLLLDRARGILRIRSGVTRCFRPSGCGIAGTACASLRTASAFRRRCAKPAGGKRAGRGGSCSGLSIRPPSG